MLSNTNIRIDQKGLPEDLLVAQNLIYRPCGFTYSYPVAERESADYGAYSFKIKGLVARFRMAKLTPTKIGQFVTLWKRIGNGPIQPFEYSDEIDLFIISVRSGARFGQFIFPKAIMQAQGIVSTATKEGKRAIRVYPPWDVTTSKQAQKTQQWQLIYFLEVKTGQPIDIVKANTLYTNWNIK